jgi:hypothetical protein
VLADAVEVLAVKVGGDGLLAETVVVLHILVHALIVRCETGHDDLRQGNGQKTGMPGVAAQLTSCRQPKNLPRK